MPPCIHCGKEIPEESLFCPSCGTQTPPKQEAELFCSMCGTKSPNPLARFCSKCGAPLYPPVETPLAHSPQPPASTSSAASIHEQQPVLPVEPRSRVSFAHDVIVGVPLQPNEKILRITPCRIKTFAIVKECLIYTTNQRLICTSEASGTIRTVTRLRRKETTKVETILPLSSLISAEISDGTLKVGVLGEGNRREFEEYVIGDFAQDLGDFIMRARSGSISALDSPLIDQYDETETKSTLQKGLTMTGKVIYQGAKVGAKLTSQLLQEYVKESESDFDNAADEEDRYGWAGRKGPKGRRAEERVAHVLKETGWRIIQRNVVLQAREIDIIVQKGARKYMIECKFGRKQIDTAQLDSYVMLYYDAKRHIGVNGLLFVCPTAGMSEYARSNVLIKYPGEKIEILDSRGWVQELEEL